jgi:cytochrome c oxidase cbb3-type subunit III
MSTPEPNSSEPQLRHHVFDGIQEYDQKLPNWWLFTFYIAIAWFVIHWLAYYQFNVGKTDEKRVDDAMAAIESDRLRQFEAIDDKKLWEMSRDPKIVEAGRASFMMQGRCVTCHGADLMSKKTHPENPTLVGLPLADREWQYGGNPTDVLKIVRKGSPDVTKGMPPWEPLLGPRGCVEAVAFIMSHHKEGEPFTIVPPPAAPGTTAAPAPAPAK